MSDLQDIIATSTVRAFNAGYEAGKRDVLNAVNFVKFEYRDLEVAAISDLKEELEMRTKNV
jgi:hypothetical protein